MFYFAAGLVGSSAYSTFYVNDVFSRDSITQLEFLNDPNVNVTNNAQITGADFEAANGKELFDLYCLPQTASDTSEPTTPGESNTSDGSQKPPQKAGPRRYPELLIRDPYNQMNGYYLGDDTVVMLIPSFDSEGLPLNHSLTFANYVTEIVTRDLDDGRAKIIIDVSVMEVAILQEPSISSSSSSPLGSHILQLDFPIMKHDFGTYQSLLGDESQLDVNIISLYANFNYTQISGYKDDAPIRGYAGRSINITQPLKTENILITGDGTCASPFTIFINLIMGGVRGAHSMGFQGIYGLVNSAGMVFKESPYMLDFISEDEVKEFMDVAPKPLESFPIVLKSGNVNLRNAYQEGDESLPLQFQYKAADCRL
ncbi:hypothetical protein DER46DRAFT_664423 [Fusarium sp. MPI-SDFR-AT-0072]|nr:hypothetical protein DER46DRAFT_664423 [Fusarium sp. MPI-SDFR-AT-0072]KAI7759572.1 hypothetical protein LZL87_013517 [Fusarium oxysporum]